VRKIEFSPAMLYHHGHHVSGFPAAAIEAESLSHKDKRAGRYGDVGVIAR
jgi:hypothetical protein